MRSNLAEGVSETRQKISQKIKEKCDFSSRNSWKNVILSQKIYGIL
jgi:hypothetical protein